MENEFPIGYGFIEDFEFEGKYYVAHIKHFVHLGEDDIINYQVCDGEFLVHLFSLTGCISFKVFLDDQTLTWHTKASKLIVDEKIVEVIGFVIDMKSFYS